MDYVQLYVDVGLECTGLLSLVANIVGGRVSRFSVEAEGLEIEVGKNGRRLGVLRNGPDAFLEYEYLVELERPELMEMTAFHALVARVMTGLHSRNASVVAACDFEEVLPGCGRLEYGGRRY